VLAVVLYDVIHKALPLSPFLMAFCRFLLVLAAGSAATHGLSGGTAWSALVLAGYIVGLSYVAKVESRSDIFSWWPLVGLLLPFVLAAFVNAPVTWASPRVLGPIAVLAIWTLRSVSHLARPGFDGPRHTVSGLLAGIVLVDLVAVMPETVAGGLVFIALFVAALVLQRKVPAT
jgi:4-hydroxybenzoate polyprenyltransferase